MTLPEIVSAEEWTRARTALLEREKELTRARDAVSADRRRLPMVEITKDYEFAGPAGKASLADLFDGRAQLVTSHFMFDPEWEEGCPSCTAGADEWSPGLERHLATRDTTLVYVSRAPIEKIERYRAARGWTFPWFSSFGSDFNADMGVTLDGTGSYNFRPTDLVGEMPGLTCFLRVGNRIFRTYSQYARGAEWTGGSYAFLDLTALGRQEDWEQPAGRAGSLRGATPDFAQ
jgi:predicted dithiol-disulfide oxidoreductase (DUF899 family)